MCGKGAFRPCRGGPRSTEQIRCGLCGRPGTGQPLRSAAKSGAGSGWGSRPERLRGSPGTSVRASLPETLGKKELKKKKNQRPPPT